MQDDEAALEALVEKAREDPRVLAVLQFGSSAEDADEARDLDVAVVLDPGLEDDTWETELGYHAVSSGERHGGLDVSIYQTLPVYIRQRVLQEAKPLLVKDQDSLYQIAFQTVREFERFKPFYEAYLDEVAHA